MHLQQCTTDSEDSPVALMLLYWLNLWGSLYLVDLHMVWSNYFASGDNLMTCVLPLEAGNVNFLCCFEHCYPENIHKRIEHQVQSTLTLHCQTSQDNSVVVIGVVEGGGAVVAVAAVLVVGAVVVAVVPVVAVGAVVKTDAFVEIAAAVVVNVGAVLSADAAVLVAGAVVGATVAVQAVVVAVSVVAAVHSADNLFAAAVVSFAHRFVVVLDSTTVFVVADSVPLVPKQLHQSGLWAPDSNHPVDLVPA